MDKKGITTMRLNTNNYRSVLSEKQISDEYVQKATGLSKKTYLWILANEFIELGTLERIADAIGCPVSDIIKPDNDGYSENCIEWVKDGEWATLSLSQRRTISEVKKLAKSHSEECQILAENKDGSLYARVPVDWIKIRAPRKISDKQRAILVEHMKNIRRGI